jgi:GH15 family glucan-1,4-alpha-glucosidase
MMTNDSEPKYSSEFKELSLSQTTIPTNVISEPGFFLIENVFSSKECENIRYIIDKNGQLPSIYREKLCFQCPKLSTEIKERCKEQIPPYVYIESADKYNIKPYNYWDSPSINMTWRLVKCNPGSKLNTHLDGTFVRNINERSVYTVMVYLSTNDDGATVFKNHEIYPKEGSVLIFNQNMEHRGDVNTIEKDL